MPLLSDLSDCSDVEGSPKTRTVKTAKIPSYEDAHRKFHLDAGVAEADIPPCLCDPDHKDVKYICTKPPVTRIQCTCCGASDPDIVMYENKRYPRRKFFKCKRCYAKRLAQGVVIGSFSCWDPAEPEMPEFRTYPPRETPKSNPSPHSSDIFSSPSHAELIAQLDAALDKPIRNIVLLTEEKDAGYRYDNIPMRNGHVCWTLLPKWLRDEFARDKASAFEVFDEQTGAWGRFGLHSRVRVKRGPVRARIVWANPLSVRVNDDVIEIFDSDDDDDDGNAGPPAVKASPKRSLQRAFESDSDSGNGFVAGASGSNPAKRVKGEKAKTESHPVASGSKVKDVINVVAKPKKSPKAKKTNRMTFGNPFKGKKKGE